MSPKQDAESIPEGQTLATFSTYKDASQFVERMIENDFPARLVSIIGTDLKTVESIRGKLGYGRVALSGAVTGSWLGMFFGLLFGATDVTAEAISLSNVAAGVVIGAGVGMMLNVIRFSLTKNRRGYISGQTVVAKKYEIVVPSEKLELAKKSAETPRATASDAAIKPAKKPAAKPAVKPAKKPAKKS